MNCNLCGGAGKIIYNGPLKTGLLSGYTEIDYPVFQCKKCGVIWNEAYKDLRADYYEIGCGGGSFLDFVKTAAEKSIAIEPDLERRQAA